MSSTEGDKGVQFDIATRSNAIRELKRLTDQIKELSPATTSVVNVEVFLERLDVVEKKFDKAHLSIETMLANDEEKLAEADVIQDSFQTSLIAAKTICRDLLESVKSHKQSAPAKPDLPEISIKPFDGRLENWLIFKNTFTSLVESNTDLTDSQKLQHLKSLLVGSAVVEIQSLESNFSAAWKILNNRYDDKLAIINAHLNALFSCTKASGEKDSLRNVSSSLKLHINALNALALENEHLDMRSAFLIFLASQKIDAASRREWELSISNQPELPSVDSFLTFMERRCQGLERSLADNSTAATLLNKNATKVTTKPRPKNKNFKSCCYLCNGNHQLFNCNKFRSFNVYKRFSVVNKSKLCINCFNKKCDPSKCRRRPCSKCYGKHNSLLHIDKRAPKSNFHNAVTSTPINPAWPLPRNDTMQSPMENYRNYVDLT